MTTSLTFVQFLRTLPECVWSHLPPAWPRLQVRQPWQQIIQFYDAAPTLHYEVAGAWQHPGLELGLHFEARDSAVNARLLTTVQRHLVEIKHLLGPHIEAEPWDRGWTKVYEVIPLEAYTPTTQMAVGARLAAWIQCLHPLLPELSGNSRRPGSRLKPQA